VHCILSCPSTVQGQQQLVVSELVAIRLSKRGNIDAKLLDQVFEVSQPRMSLPKFPFSGSSADLGAICLPPPSSHATVLPSTQLPRTVVDEAFHPRRRLGDVAGARAR